MLVDIAERSQSPWYLETVMTWEPFLHYWPFVRETTSDRWIPLTKMLRPSQKATELWYFWNLYFADKLLKKQPIGRSLIKSPFTWGPHSAYVGPCDIIHSSWSAFPKFLWCVSGFSQSTASLFQLFSVTILKLKTKHFLECNGECRESWIRLILNGKWPKFDHFNGEPSRVHLTSLGSAWYRNEQISLLWRTV